MVGILVNFRKDICTDNCTIRTYWLRIILIIMCCLVNLTFTNESVEIESPIYVEDDYILAAENDSDSSIEGLDPNPPIPRVEWTKEVIDRRSRFPSGLSGLRPPPPPPRRDHGQAQHYSFSLVPDQFDLFDMRKQLYGKF